MDKIFNIIKRGCFYSVIISFVIYAMLGLSGGPGAGIQWNKFLIIVCYGLVISFAEWLGTVLPLRSAFKVTINFVINLAAFIAVYFLIGGTSALNAGRAFIFISIFVIAYAIIMLISRLIVRVSASISEKKNAPVKKRTEPEYHPLYGDED